MITNIGITAGEIWHYLENSNIKDDIDGIAKNIGKPRDVVLMSLGWLAREGHVVLKGDLPNYEVSLRVVA